jgi:hypothetical protein
VSPRCIAAYSAIYKTTGNDETGNIPRCEVKLLNRTLLLTKTTNLMTNAVIDGHLLPLTHSQPVDLREVSIVHVVLSTRYKRGKRHSPKEPQLVKDSLTIP